MVNETATSGFAFQRIELNIKSKTVGGGQWCTQRWTEAYLDSDLSRPPPPPPPPGPINLGQAST